MVENFLTLDINKYLDQLDFQSESKIPSSYMDLASRIYYNRRLEFCKIAQQNISKYPNLHLTLDAYDYVGNMKNVLKREFDYDVDETVFDDKKVKPSYMSTEETNDGMFQ